MWRDIVAIVFICTTANHLGLISAIGSAIKRKLWIIDCPKCFTFWCVSAYLLITQHGVIQSFAISLLCAYSSIWLELLEGIIDKLYDYVYQQIYPATGSTDPDEECS